jgi:hypothetical protein
MTAIFPWMLALNPVDQEQRSRDLLSATRTALETGQPDRVISDMLSWRETAPATGDGLKSSPNDWRESLELVDRPE